jgi:hypothetical protein
MLSGSAERVYLAFMAGGEERGVPCGIHTRKGMSQQKSLQIEPWRGDLESQFDEEKSNANELVEGESNSHKQKAERGGGE